MALKTCNSASGAALRPLAAFEHLSAHWDAVLGFNFSVTFTFQGTVAHDRWQHALHALQKRHPLLRAGIQMDGEQGPVFVDAPHRPIEIRFARRSSASDWQRVMEAEFNKVFDLEGPLLRANVLEDDDGCDLILCAHHSVLDAIGMIALVRDLFQILSEIDLPALPLPSATDQHIERIRQRGDFPEGVGHASEDWGAAVAALSSRKIQPHKGRAVCHVSALRIDKDQTERLLRSARKEASTVGAALLAALAICVGKDREASGDTEIRLGVPIDARPLFGNHDDCVLAAFVSRAYLPLPHPGFWQSARHLRACVSSFHSLIEVEASRTRLNALFATKLPPETMINALQALAGFDVCVSNLKNVDVLTGTTGLALQSVWGPSILAGSLNGHYVGSATANGALHLTYSSHAPIEGLLDEMHRILIEATEF